MTPELRAGTTEKMEEWSRRWLWSEKREGSISGSTEDGVLETCTTRTTDLVNEFHTRRLKLPDVWQWSGGVGKLCKGRKPKQSYRFTYLVNLFRVVKSSTVCVHQVCSMYDQYLVTVTLTVYLTSSRKWYLSNFLWTGLTMRGTDLIPRMGKNGTVQEDWPSL